jgi:hypothetical protein
MTITSITIENFKGIRDRVKIDLKPITMLFGPNSGGKSTIIQALHYAWEVIGRHNLDPNFTEFGGREIDLGGFENLVYGHDLSRSISIRLDIDLAGKNWPVYGDEEAILFAQSEQIGEEIEMMYDGWHPDNGIPIFRWNISRKKISKAWIEFNISWSESNSKVYVSSFEVGFNNEMLCKIKTQPDSNKITITSINFFHPLLLVNKDECLDGKNLPASTWLNDLISTFAKKPEIWLNEKFFSSDQYSFMSDLCNLFKEYSALSEECSNKLDNPDDEHLQIDTFEKMTDEELRQMAKQFGYRYIAIKTWDRDQLIGITKASYYNNKMKSLKKLTIDQLRQVAKSHGYSNEEMVNWDKSHLLAIINLSQKTERMKKLQGVNERINENIEQLLPYEFLFICIEAFGIRSIHEDLNIECAGLTDALPQTDETLEIKALPKKRRGSIEYVIDYFTAMDSAIKQIILGPLKFAREELQKLSYLGPIRSRIPRNYVPNRYVEKRNWPGGLAAWDVLHKSDEEFVKSADHWMADRLKSGYHIIRKIYKEIDVSKIMPKKKNISEQYNLAPTKTRLYLIDEKNKVELQPPDVGVGISQVIPVIVSALYFKDGIMAIEQPELHIHPALQVTLGDLFISQIQEKGLCFLVETHSEHLMLRFLRRIRETSEGVPRIDKSELKPDQLAIYYIEPGENGLTVSQIRVDQDGEFLDRWPRGFFNERVEELY